MLGPEETFSDLWRDDYLQVTSKIAHQTLHWLNLEPYSCAVLEQGLQARKVKDDGEECETLERVMEYTGIVRVEVLDMLTAVHEKVWALEPRVPMQHTVTHPNGLGYFWEETEPRKSRQENNRGRKRAEEENHGQER